MVEVGGDCKFVRLPHQGVGCTDTEIERELVKGPVGIGYPGVFLRFFLGVALEVSRQCQTPSGSWGNRENEGQQAGARRQAGNQVERRRQRGGLKA